MFDYRREQLLSPQSRSSEPIAQNIISRIKNCFSEILGMYSYLLGLIQYNTMPIIKDKNCWRAGLWYNKRRGPPRLLLWERPQQRAGASRASKSTHRTTRSNSNRICDPCLPYIPVYLDELVGVVTRRHFSSVIKIEVNSRLYLFSVAE